MILLSIIIFFFEAESGGLGEKIVMIAVGAAFGQVSAIVLYLLNKNQNRANVGKTEAETIQILQTVISDLQTKIADWIGRFEDGKIKAIGEMDKLEQQIDDLKDECENCFRDQKSTKEFFRNIRIFFLKLENVFAAAEFLPILLELKQYQADLAEISEKYI